MKVNRKHAMGAVQLITCTRSARNDKSTVRRMEKHGPTWAQRTAAGPSHIESNDEETHSNPTVAAQTTARQTDADCVINDAGESEQEHSTEHKDTHNLEPRQEERRAKEQEQVPTRTKWADDITGDEQFTRPTAKWPLLKLTTTHEDRTYVTHREI
jgi:hypothetical protein